MELNPSLTIAPFGVRRLAAAFESWVGADPEQREQAPAPHSANGEAISLVCVDELDFLRSIERLTKRSLPREKVAGFEPDPNARAQPIQLRSQQNRAAPARGAHAGKGRPSGKASQPASARPGGPKPFGGKPGAARPGTRSGSAHRSGGRHR